ncbi:hypothetical protein [Mesorhizobium sp. B2-4-6]|uniref:hypothetical protein n=1 Tax=Mesorhizobium sp. B2-4-6 TaxID=2589943 RepID=UPI001127240E|nr:hypothetical protein [Mesorhizobium sp. B2-4-6]TPL40649.1 hypothetical protein FJ957_25810 [Mesorhizobium sp. B2-4-6]
MTGPHLTPEQLTWPTGPYAVLASKSGGGNGLPNLYVTDAGGRKIAAIWGGADERYATAYLLAAGPALVEALRAEAEAKAFAAGISEACSDGAGPLPKHVMDKADQLFARAERLREAALAIAEGRPPP